MYRIFILLAALLICFGCTTEFDRQLEAVKEILKANNMDPELARSIADKLNENVYSICIQDDSLRVISDAIGRLPKVRYLNLNFNKIEFISEEIGKCTSLVEIELVGNNLKKLPESIGNLKNLEILELRANQLEELPESFGNLQKLRELSLQRNRLKRLPESYGNLNTGGHLNDNQLETLPESFANLKISEIDLINNNIKIFRENQAPTSGLALKTIHLTSLQYLQL